MRQSTGRLLRQTFLYSIAVILVTTTLPGCGGGDDPAPTNTAPQVQAGADQSVELPINKVNLTGSATDSGSSTLTYSWTSNPATGVTFGSTTAAATDATFTTAGTYTLTLSASDGSLSGTDSLQVTVAPAVYPAADTDADANHGWTAATPADVGLDEADLIQARDYALTGGGAGLISRRGRLVYSWGDIDARFDMKSTTKSIGGIALGLAIDEGKVALTAAAQTYLPSIGDPPNSNVATGWLDDITVLQLATHTAGFEKPGGYIALINQPGTTWAYSDGGLNWLADLLTAVYGADLSQLLTTRVWTPLGITTDDLQWRANSFRPGPHPDGLEHRELASGIVANVNAMARVGLLFLRKGVWANDQRLLSEEFVNTAQTPRSETAQATLSNPTDFPAATQNYGVLWWTNKTQLMPNVPADAYWAWGLGDSLIIVIPSLDLVIARTGNDPDVAGLPRWRDGWNGNYTVLEPFITPIAQAVTP